MSDDRDIRSAIRSGERNRDVSILVRNWCEHARVEKFGGTGLVEAQTGLPIGHHSMACDHASAAGFSSWDLTQSALDFHDRNCQSCSHRKPVRIPNLSTLVGERDRAKATQDARRKEQEQARANALENRSKARKLLQAKIPLASRTVIDQIEALDRGDRASATTLVRTAELAPEIFTSEVVEYIFQQLESSQRWLFEAGLPVLNTLRAGPPVRLCACAMTALADYSSLDASTEIVLRTVDVVRVDDIKRAFHSLATMASPSRGISHIRAIAPRLEPITSLFRAHEATILWCIKKRLDSRNPSAIQEAASTLELLSRTVHPIMQDYVNDIVALLTRPDHLIDFDDEYSRQIEDDLFRDLEGALELALFECPEHTDKVVEGFLSMVSDDAGARVFHAYDNLFRARRNDGMISETPAHTIALKRMLNAATVTKSDEVLRIVGGIVQHAPSPGLEPLIKRELTFLVGVAAVLDSVIDGGADPKQKPPANFLETLERNNRRSALESIQSGAIRWAMDAAAEDESASRELLSLYAALPEGRESFRAVFVRALGILARSDHGLNSALPHIYGAMVGRSVLLRNAALSALKKIGKKRSADLPDLVHEALCASLADPFIAVHQQAVRTLEKIEIPPSLRPTIGARLIRLLSAYAPGSQYDEFLLQLILYVGREFSKDGEIDDKFADYAISLIAKMKSESLTREIRWLDRRLRARPGFADVAVRLLAAAQYDHDAERLWDVIREMSTSQISSIANQLSVFAIADKQRHRVAGTAVEVLSYGGAWDKAALVASTAEDSIPATVRNKPLKLRAKQLQLAADFEAAVATGHDTAPFAAAWAKLEDEIEETRREHASRRGPFPGFLNPD